MPKPRKNKLFDQVGSRQRTVQNNECYVITSNTTYASASEPPDPVVGMMWLDTTNHIMKIRNEENNGWVDVFNLAGYAYGCSGTIEGRGINVSGNLQTGDVTLSLSDGGITQEKLADYIAGDLLLATIDGRIRVGEEFDLGTSYTKIAGMQLDKGGSLRFTFDLRSYRSNRPYIELHVRIHRRRAGILTAVGTERSVSENDSAESFTEDISGWKAGDIVEVHAFVSRLPTEEEQGNIYAPYVFSVGPCSIKTGNWYRLMPA